MICETRIIPKSGQFLISTGPSDGAYWQNRRALVVRLGSVGQKFITKEGFLRDLREHDSDMPGMEFEVELVDLENEPARFFTTEQKLLDDLKQAGQGATVAIGWQVLIVNRRRMKADAKPSSLESPTEPVQTREYINVAWRVDC